MITPKAKECHDQSDDQRVISQQSLAVLLARVEVSARRGRLISDSAEVVGGIYGGKEHDVVGWYGDSGRIHRSQTCTGQDPF